MSSPIVEQMVGTSPIVEAAAPKDEKAQFEKLFKEGIKGEDFEKAVVEIVRNCMVQMWRSMWQRRSSWRGDVVNQKG